MKIEANIIGSLSAAMTLLSRLKQVGDRIKDAEFSGLLAQLNIDLSQARVENAALAEENATLKQRIRELEGRARWREVPQMPPDGLADRGQQRG